MSASNTVLVCVTAQESSKALIKTGEIIAKEKGAVLEVISVLPLNNPEKNSPQITEALFQTVKECQGKMAVYFSDEPVITVAAHIGKNKPELLVAGFPGENSNNFVSVIKLIFPNLPISMVSKENVVYNLLPLEKAVNK